MRCSLMPARARLSGQRHDVEGVDTIMPDVGGDGEQGTATDHH
uniref:Uncharacterized protein n=1 Tax=Arundo donax TaxID=35708 RepID=A0A0A8YPG3_ARUDO